MKRNEEKSKRFKLGLERIIDEQVNSKKKV